LSSIQLNRLYEVVLQRALVRDHLSSRDAMTRDMTASGKFARNPDNASKIAFPRANLIIHHSLSLPIPLFRAHIPVRVSTCHYIISKTSDDKSHAAEPPVPSLISFFHSSVIIRCNDVP